MVNIFVCGGTDGAEAENENETLKNSKNKEGEDGDSKKGRCSHCTYENFKSKLTRKNIGGALLIIYAFITLAIDVTVLVNAYIEISGIDYVVASTSATCGEAQDCAKYDVLEDFPGDAVVIDKKTAIFRDMKVGKGEGSEPYKCKNVDGKTLDQGVVLHNPACHNVSGTCEKFFKFGPSSNTLRIIVIWLSIAFVLLFDVTQFCIEVAEKCGLGNCNLILVDVINEMGLPIPNFVGVHVAVGVFLFLIKGVLLCPSVIIPLFDMSDTHNPCLGIEDGVSLKFLLGLNKVFLLSPVCFLAYVGMMAAAQNEADEKGETAETLQRKEMAEKGAYCCIAAFLLAAFVTNAYIMYVEFVGSPQLFLGHFYSFFGVAISGTFFWSLEEE